MIWTVTVMHTKLDLEGDSPLATGAFESGTDAWDAMDEFIKTKATQFVKDQYPNSEVEVRRHGPDNTEYVVDGCVTDQVYGLVGCGNLGEMTT